MAIEKRKRRNIELGYMCGGLEVGTLRDETLRDGV